jgi:hypothetical protein
MASKARETLAERTRPYTMSGASRRTLRVKVGRPRRMFYRAR